MATGSCDAHLTSNFYGDANILTTLKVRWPAVSVSLATEMARCNGNEITIYISSMQKTAPLGYVGQPTDPHYDAKQTINNAKQRLSK